ncbi:MAG: hypothetical protein WCE51_12125 [Chthoniobacterales bacterium]
MKTLFAAALDCSRTGAAKMDARSCIFRGHLEANDGGRLGGCPADSSAGIELNKDWKLIGARERK